MRKCILIFGASIILSAGSAVAQTAAAPASAGGTFDLVTESEAQNWSSVGPTEPTDFKTRDLSADNGTPTCASVTDNDADNPQIKITQPTLEKPLITPIDIDLKFIQAGSAPIRPETLRVCYVGLVTKDITRRITDRAAVSAQGLRVTGVQLPHGHHRLLLLVADERGRLARREFVFNVL